MSGSDDAARADRVRLARRAAQFNGLFPIEADNRERQCRVLFPIGLVIFAKGVQSLCLNVLLEDICAIT